MVAEAADSLGRPSGSLVFVSSDLGARLPELGQRLSELKFKMPVLVVAGHGVLTERGELEGQSAASGIVWSGGESEVVSIPGRESDMGVALAEALRPRAAPRAAAFVFSRPRGFAPQTLEPLQGLRFGSISGGGTAGDERVLAVSPGVEPRVTDAGALVLRGLSPPAVRASPACRLLSPLAPITATRGPMVLEIGGERALEVLSNAARSLSGQPLVIVALAPEADADGESQRVLVRGIQGVDPMRQGVLVSEEVRPGLRMAFAVRDAAAARAEIESMSLRLARDTAGAAPLFGVYLSCAGRGASLYGSPDVDVRILRSRFPKVPFSGMHSSFEIAPRAGQPTMELYTGVFALFTMPS